MDFFFNIAVQMLGVAVIFAVLYGLSKIRKPKEGESSEQQILDYLALVRITIFGPLMLWFVPAIGSLFYIYFTESFDVWPILVAFWIPLVFYIGWAAAAGFNMMFKRNFMAARIAYTRSPKTYNVNVVNDPRFARRLALYPAALRKAFMFLADSKWF